LFGLAHAKEAAGDTAGALDAYTQAGALAGPYRTDALLGAGRLHEASGRADDARAVYEGLLKDAGDPETKALLTQKLAAVGKPSAAAP
jgi:predicted TPR repeat methyltransferase